MPQRKVRSVCASARECRPRNCLRQAGNRRQNGTGTGGDFRPREMSVRAAQAFRFAQEVSSLPRRKSKNGNGIADEICPCLRKPDDPRLARIFRGLQAVPQKLRRQIAWNFRHFLDFVRGEIRRAQYNRKPMKKRAQITPLSEAPPLGFAGWLPLQHRRRRLYCPRHSEAAPPEILYRSRIHLDSVWRIREAPQPGVSTREIPGGESCRR